MNRKFTDEKKTTFWLVLEDGGSSDTWLGIPVKWPHISNARCDRGIRTRELPYRPSQGTHFFQISRHSALVISLLTRLNKMVGLTKIF